MLADDQDLSPELQGTGIPVDRKPGEPTEGVEERRRSRRCRQAIQHRPVPPWLQGKTINMKGHGGAGRAARGCPKLLADDGVALMVSTRIHGVIDEGPVVGISPSRREDRPR